MVSKSFVDNIKVKFSGFFLPTVKFMNRINVQPNLLTSFSLIFGLLSAYFLFYNNGLFILFIGLSLIFDILDGQLARYSEKTTKFGVYFDTCSDRLVQISLLLKAAWFYPISYYVIIIYFLHFMIFLFMKKKIIFYSRTAMIIFFAFGFYELGILYTLLLSLYGIIKQITIIIRSNIKNKT